MSTPSEMALTSPIFAAMPATTPVADIDGVNTRMFLVAGFPFTARYSRPSCDLALSALLLKYSGSFCGPTPDIRSAPILMRACTASASPMDCASPLSFANSMSLTPKSSANARTSDACAAAARKEPRIRRTPSSFRRVRIWGEYEAPSPNFRTTPIESTN